MTEENGQHEFNFFLDKQIQQRLLEADEELLAKQSLSSQVPSNCRQKASSVIGSIGGQGNSNQINANKNNSSNFQKALNKELQTIPLCGWCAEATVTYRKTENDGSSKSKGNTGISSREALLSRDSRNRPQATQEFMFRHYTDPRRYIEQYRREHVCYDTANSSATKNEFLDTRRFYAYNQYSPLAVCTQNSTFQQSSTLPPPLQESTFVQSSEQQQQSQSRQPQTPTILYTNRRDQQRQTIHATLRSNNQHKYKFSNAMPSKSDSNQVYDKVSEFSESSDHSRRAGSAKESPSTPTINGVSVQKALAAKVNVPSSNSGVMSARNLKPPRPGSPQEPNITNQFMSQKLGQGSGGPSRTLDTLACVAGSAGEKQPSSSAKTRARSDSNHNNHNHNHNANNNIISNDKSRANTPRNSKGSASTKDRSLVSTNGVDCAKNADGAVSNYESIYTNGGSGVLPHKSPLDNGSGSDTEEDSDSAVSIGQLSTTCLGVEAKVKQRPKLEPSCTYHVFPNDFISSGFSPVLVWNPSKSSLDKRPVATPYEPGMAAPFRNSPRVRPSTEEGHRTVEFITKEFIPESRPLNLCPDISRENSSLTNVSPGLKANTIKPDLPATFQLQGFSKRPHFEALKKKRCLSKTAGARRKKDAKDPGGRKSWSASTDASSSNGKAMKLKPVTTAELLKSPKLDAGNGKNSTTPNATPSLGPVPYFKFWNSSLPAKSRDGRGARRDKSHDLNLQQLAEMVLSDENGRKDRDLAEAAKKVLEHQQTMESDQQTRAGIASGSSGVPEAVDSSTQARLESLRRVNKRAAKPQPAQLHLTFIREEESLRHPSHPPPTHQLDCKEVSRMLQPQQTPQSSDLPSSSIILTTTNNNANDPNNSVSSSNDGSDKDGRTVGDATKKPRKTRSKVSEETFSSWKERSLLAMKELEGSQLRDCGSDRRSLAKKFEERTLISHRRRIKHLIEQSRLKSKFGQFLGQAKGPSRKTTLKLSNIQIGDPYVIAASGRDGDKNNSNSGREESHDMDKLHYAWSSTGKHGSETQSESRHPDTGSVLTVSDTISKFHTTLYNNESGRGKDVVRSRNCDDSDQMLKNAFNAPRHPSSAEDKNSGVPRQDELMGHDFFSHFRGNLDDRAHVPVAYEEPRGDNQWNKENDNDSYLPGEDNLFLTSVHKRYIDKLAEQVSATVKFRVPKFKYSNVTDMNRSQTMNL